METNLKKEFLQRYFSRITNFLARIANYFIVTIVFNIYYLKGVKRHKSFSAGERPLSATTPRLVTSRQNPDFPEPNSAALRRRNTYHTLEIENKDMLIMKNGFKTAAVQGTIYIILI